MSCCRCKAIGGRAFGPAIFATALLLSTASAHAAPTGSARAASRAPLADAAENMDRARIRALLKQHVAVNTPQADGMTALHWAAYQDDLELAQLLVRAGGNVKAAVDRHASTRLILAPA